MIEPKRFIIGTDGELTYYVEAVNIKQAILQFAEYVGISEMDLFKKYLPTYTITDTIKVFNRLSSVGIKSVMEVRKRIYGDNYDNLGYLIITIR